MARQDDGTNKGTDNPFGRKNEYGNSPPLVSPLFEGPHGFRGDVLKDSPKDIFSNLTPPIGGEKVNKE